MSVSSSINPEEIENFAKDSSHWWDEQGPFKPLHRMNPTRISYIHGQICDHFGLTPTTLRPFETLKVLDIGCGGGLICEPMARMGAETYGIDADKNAIAVAMDHAHQGDLDIAYRNQAAEDLLPKEQGQYDVVMALEIIEHVNDPDGFIKTAAQLCKPGGLLIISTMNRTAKSYAMAIAAAEYILRWVPRGTHHWDKFLKPAELAAMLRAAQAAPRDETGIILNLFTGDFVLSDSDLDVNYFMSAVKA